MPRGDGTILDPNVHEAFIRNYAQQRGLDPDFITRLAAAEGLNAWSAANPNAGNNPALSGGRSISYGDFQLNTSNGLGVTARQHGIDPTNPNQWQQADKFAIDYIAQTRDLRPWETNPVAAACRKSRCLHARQLRHRPSSRAYRTCRSSEHHGYFQSIKLSRRPAWECPRVHLASHRGRQQRAEHRQHAQ